MKKQFHLFIILLFVLLGCSNSYGSPDKEKSETSFEPDTEKAGPPAKDEADYGGTLALLPLGKVDDEAISTAAQSIKDAYNWRVILMDREKMPKVAYYKPRKRYRAEKILAWITPKLPVWADKIMALTKKDISTTKPPHYDWGICGLADLDGPASVVSTFRIKKKMGKISKKKKHEKYLQRLIDLTAHEFGHNLGLEHCPNKGCIMEDAKGTVLTFDHSSGSLCDECKKKLIKKGLYKSP